VSDEDIAIEPSPEPLPDESPFESQPLDTQERSLDALRETRDGD
jgi:hypothetical protein